MPSTTKAVLSLCMPQGKSVAEPKASWLMKFPQRPMPWPIRKPKEAMSSTAATFILRIFAIKPPKTTAPIKPP